MLPDLSTSYSGAQHLLGWELGYQSPEGYASGIIVETEAYGPDDPAAHSFRGQTPRNAAIFGPAGTIYIYFIYGMHYCINFACGEEGDGQAVLIRALQPLHGQSLMQARRGAVAETAVTNGPGKLVQALGIPKALNGQPVKASQLTLQPHFEPKAIVERPRIGISKATDRLWRFYIKDNPFISKP